MRDLTFTVVNRATKDRRHDRKLVADGLLALVAIYKAYSADGWDVVCTFDHAPIAPLVVFA